MNKIMSLLDDNNNNNNDFSSSSSGSSGEGGAFYVPNQIKIPTPNSSHDPNGNGFCPVVPVPTVEANVNEDCAIWNGIWNLDLEGQESFGDGACVPRKHCFQNWPIPFNLTF